MQELSTEQQQQVSGGCADCVPADRRPLYAQPSVYNSPIAGVGTPVIWTPPPTLLPPLEFS